jgi:hypothetical protein
MKKKNAMQYEKTPLRTIQLNRPRIRLRDKDTKLTAFTSRTLLHELYARHRTGVYQVLATIATGVAILELWAS